MRVVAAPDKFKGSLAAPEVARAISDGVRRSHPDAVVACLPLADGGDGTVDAAVAAGFDRVPVALLGPTGGPIDASYARRGEHAVVELASACGLVTYPRGRLAPLDASSSGFGIVIREAVRAGARTVTLAVGGSASTDGGAGMLEALGARMLDESGAPVPPGGRGLASTTRLELGELRDLVAGVRFEVAADVDSPLLGPSGAAAVYAPQKGAGPTEVEFLDRALTRWADVVARATGADLSREPGAGAAGGVGFAALAVLGGRMRSGADAVAELTGFDEALRDADLCITGEGSLDRQTLRGKTVAGVARRARRQGVPVVAVAGIVRLTADELERLGVLRAVALIDLQPDRERCMRDAAELVTRASEQLTR